MLLNRTYLNILKTRNYNLSLQCLICIGLVLLISFGCYFTLGLIDYRTVALILLLSVSLLAMLFDIVPVLIAAVLSALIWNFFFIPPLFTFHIEHTEDMLMFLMYFAIALLNAVLSFKIRQEEKKTRDKEEKEHAIKLYNTLLNSLSHELRTPISTILGAVDVLKEKENKLSASNQLELLNQIDIASIRLNRQVENLLNMNRLEAGMIKLNLDWCDTNELIYQVIQTFIPLETHTLLFNPDEKLPLIKIDRGLMEQILQNLIHNAVQYTEQPATIQITASLQNELWVLRVSDNGPGIPVSELPHLFEKFYRVPQSKAGGTGLGLSIVKGYAEAHQGQVQIENNTSGGVSFIVKIPAEVSYINNLKNE